MVYWWENLISWCFSYLEFRVEIDRKGATRAMMIDQGKGHAGILLIMGHQHHPVWGRTTTGSPLRPPAPLYKPTRRESTVLTAPPLRLLMSCNTIQWHQPELGWTRKCLNCALGIISGRRQWTLWTWLLSDLSFCCSGCVMIHHQSPLDVGNKLYTSATVLSMLISSNVGLKHLL